MTKANGATILVPMVVACLTSANYVLPHADGWANMLMAGWVIFLSTLGGLTIGVLMMGRKEKA